MKCIVCDRCRGIIEDPRRCKVVTCAKPLRFEPEFKPAYRGNDRQMNDIIWEKELCSECAELLNSFMDGVEVTPEPSPEPTPEPEPTPDPEPTPEPEPTPDPEQSEGDEDVSGSDAGSDEW